MAVREYVNFDLELGPRGEGYATRVRASPVGEARGSFALPFSPEALENVVLRLGRSRTTVRRIASRQDELVRGFGGQLYEALFAGEVGTSLRRSIDEAAREDKGLRIRLHLEETPELGDVPWELLYSAGLSRHLALSSWTPLVRYLGLPGTPRPLRVDGPIRVLVAVAAPGDVVRLDTEHELELINRATADLQEAGALAVDGLTRGTLQNLQRRLRRADYHVLHFIGHGGFDEREGEGVLAFEHDDGRSHLVRSSHLGTILADHSTLRLAVLNACEGARSSSTDPFAGVAQALVRQGIPAVIAMQFEITDAAAAILGHELYLALADGCAVDHAVGEARKALYASECDVEWATPVLYLRAPDGRLFETAGVDLTGRLSPVSVERDSSDAVVRDVQPPRERSGTPPADVGWLVQEAPRPGTETLRQRPAEKARPPSQSHHPSLSPHPVPIVAPLPGSQAVRPQRRPAVETPPRRGGRRREARVEGLAPTRPGTGGNGWGATSSRRAGVRHRRRRRGLRAVLWLIAVLVALRVAAYFDVSVVDWLEVAAEWLKANVTDAIDAIGVAGPAVPRISDGRSPVTP